MSLNGEFKPSSLYVALNARQGYGDQYHWALVTTDEKRHPTLRHANNLKGPWEHEVKDFSMDARPFTIVLARVGDIRDQNRMIAVTRAMPADGEPSVRTGKPFNCRSWMLDVIAALNEEGVSNLPASLEDVEEAVAKCGAHYAEAAERGEGATIVDDPFAAENAKEGT
ncbi:hypothetical protein F5Y18DRAFT_358173 [Xylariaceae sp. FL1019]|nr:hypothetical protein F5Y18DRAFT_358173 [Xylariaceae sp. FL1019]